mmetsp:Transcript_12307/g.40405  ORF Transcript_12307/g.40405 Transcript_12307/m.40405 type:complete len:465 (+) Transcript_12307:14-1408(+)
MRMGTRALACAVLAGFAGLCFGSEAYPEAGGGEQFGVAQSLDLPELSVHAAGVVEQILELARHNELEAPAVTRLIFTKEDMEARGYVKRLMRDVGLEVREDAMGNIYGRWVGSDPSLAAVGSGSHTDAIPGAGMYDGVLGVLGPIEAVRALKETGFVPRRSIDVIMFTSEEPTRFGFGCIGSRAMAGALPVERLDRAVDILDAEEGSFGKAACGAGYGGCEGHADMLERVNLGAGFYDAFVELHIEQGPLLEQKGLDIGIVTAIAAPAALRVEFRGGGGHAGALLMPYRNDAGLAGAELALAVEAAVLATGSNDTVGTTGLFKISPGAINSVPREAVLEIDVRDIDGPRRDGVVSQILASADEIAARRGVEVSVNLINQDPPASCGDAIINAVEGAANSLGLDSMRMVSRAYHDSLFMARVGPIGMIFIPCRDGVSHRPDEFSSMEAIGRGVHTLALSLARLSA